MSLHELDYTEKDYPVLLTTNFTGGDQTVESTCGRCVCTVGPGEAFGQAEFLLRWAVSSQLNIL